MLILPPGHAEAIQTRHALTRREKWILSSVLATALALAVVVVIAVTTSDQKSTQTCISVTAPSFIGAEQVSGCGARARAICASAANEGTYNQAFARAIAAECRKVGIPVGP